MASERPICECGQAEAKHYQHGLETWIVEGDLQVSTCPGYRPAPAETTPERDAVDAVELPDDFGLLKGIERMPDDSFMEYVQIPKEQYERMKERLAALTPPDEPAAATDGTLGYAEVGGNPNEVRLYGSEGGPYHFLVYLTTNHAEKFAAEINRLISAARRADPTPAERRRIEEAFAGRVKALMLDEFGEPRFYGPDELWAAIDEELGREG
jgi:hypothetical protein